MRTVTVELMALTLGLLAIGLGLQWRAAAAGRLPPGARGLLRASTIVFILAVLASVAALLT